jgi:hypothetical protein
MDSLLCFEWNVMRGVSWAAAAIEKFADNIETNSVVYPCVENVETGQQWSPDDGGGTDEEIDWESMGGRRSEGMQ